MEKYSDVVLNRRGEPVSGASVTVYVTGTNSKPNLYSDRFGSVALANPVSTDSTGRFSFYVEDGRYDVTVTGTGITTQTVSDILIQDIDAGLTLDGALVVNNKITANNADFYGGPIRLLRSTNVLLPPQGYQAFAEQDTTNSAYAEVKADPFMGVVFYAMKTGSAPIPTLKLNVQGTDVYYAGTSSAVHTVESFFEQNARFSKDIICTGLSERFQADFSNATIASRFAFQTSTAGSFTDVAAIPSSGGPLAQWSAYASSDVNNSSIGFIRAASGSEVRIGSTAVGSGTLLPMTFHVGGSERARIDTSGNTTFLSGTFGYGAGAGGTVTQATSRTTGVTLNKPSGQITLFSTTTTAGTFSSFTLTNSFIAATDTVIVSFSSGATADRYGLLVTSLSAGSCRIQIHNVAAVGVAEAPVINFAVIKGSTT